MTKRLSAALRAHRHLRGARVLCRDDGKTITTNVLRRWLEQAERRAEFEVHGAAHKLLHTFCSHLAMRSAPARAIQELAGHKDLTTTQRYITS
jgi:site-specific recombinase XerD